MAFQRACWEAFARGESGLLQASTGYGKTLAAIGGVLRQGRPLTGLGVLWVTPLRALANDTAQALRDAIEGVGLSWEVGVRHGDVGAAERRKQRRRTPEVLITTPESLTIALSYPNAEETFSSLRLIVCDEWHELMGTKRGVQTELALARLRTLAPTAQVWGLSATVANVRDALRALLGVGGESGQLIMGPADKPIEVVTLLPESIERFPWAGHLGLRMAPAVVEQIRQARTTLVFTNTRGQCELWYQRLTALAPDLAQEIAAHHGSLDKAERERVEAGLAEGALRAVVCTSSLDLGVDFSPVEQTVQIGSPKGIARLIQRAGRSGHQPGAVSRIYGVPTHALEILEFSAARVALSRGDLEERPLIRRPLDVLLQHWITMALTGVCSEEALWEEVQRVAAFEGLSREDWNWVGGFVRGEVGALRAYPEYARVAKDDTGVLRPSRPEVERRHRMAIGTITSDSEVTVRFLQGKVLGQIEERFVSRLNPGDRFRFAGRILELTRLRGMTAYVKLAGSGTGASPTWAGGRAPLSSELAAAVSHRLWDGGPSGADAPDQEMAALEPLLKIQRERSRLPGGGRLLIESARYQGAWLLCFYPFAGRLAHEGLAALVAYRLTRCGALTVRTTVNDYGFSLQSTKPFDLDEARARAVLSVDRLDDDLAECVNVTELARRRFREIARISGLVFQGYPGQKKSAKTLQMSSGLLYDVFSKYDPENRLARQARVELLDRELERERMHQSLVGLEGQPIDLVELEAMTPFAFTLWAESAHDQQSSESWAERVAAHSAVLDRSENA